MKTSIIAVAMALCLMAGTSASAQDSKRDQMNRERPTAEQMAQRKTDRMVEKLKLDETQSKKLYDLNLQEMKDMQAQHEQMRKAREAKSEKMKSILTPEQYEQWKRMQKQAMHNRRGGNHDRSQMHRDDRKGHGPQMKDRDGKKGDMPCCDKAKGEKGDKPCRENGKDKGKKGKK